MKKDAYSRFKSKLSEEEFRRYWGDRTEGMVGAMNANRRLAGMETDPQKIKEYLDAADKLYIELGILGSVFLSLEDFRVEEKGDRK